jgi:deoxycytidylate deaminase
MNLVTATEPELVFGLVAPVGTDVDDFERSFRDAATRYHYEVRTITLSSIVAQISAERFGVTVDESTYFKRVDTLMTLGNRIRASAKRGDVLALHAIARIAQRRAVNLDPRFPTEPYRRVVHFLRSLKHEALRRVYGPGFFLIGLNTNRDERRKAMILRKHMSLEQAEHLLSRDENEDDPYGQKTRDTFALADVFVDDDDYNGLQRFFDLVFDAPFITPTSAEHAMFLAYAASLRSGQFARQVGAVVVSAAGELIASGANDVPRFGGGLYWPGPDDRRDHVRGYDSNDSAIRGIVTEIVEVVCATHPEVDRDQLAERIQSRTRVGDLTEFGRVVHAEMEALLACARVGVSPRGGTLYATTFPCHNCAKHIVAAGIREVRYIEPYPKSRAIELHDDAVTTDPRPTDRLVRFLPFVGVAARRYFDLFSMKLGAGKELDRRRDGQMRVHAPPNETPRMRMSPFGYLEREQLVIDLIKEVDRTIAPPATAMPATRPPAAAARVEGLTLMLDRSQPPTPLRSDTPES